ncbi:stress protein [Amycolatopsis thailandensis]|uniref:Stress protein n=1 Tax=Amycolatopsis thailandensis TaxID=589330 RepID=A0A229SIH1_9PSEU|nr:Dabb family protein [Amycolatopsis thailandensis]OXM58521.1 stress protein [Amycolatopsis thailandensis]
MIVQFMRFAFREESTEKQKARALELIRRTAKVESVAYSTVGRLLGDPAEGYTHGYSFGLADLDAFERYMYDPVHLAGDTEILPHYAKLHVGVAVTDDPDPDLGAKISAVYEGKLARYPEWERLMTAIPEVRFG